MLDIDTYGSAWLCICCLSVIFHIRCHGQAWFVKGLVSRMINTCCGIMHRAMLAMLCKPKVHMPIKNACKLCV